VRREKWALLGFIALNELPYGPYPRVYHFPPSIRIIVDSDREDWVACLVNGTRPVISDERDGNQLTPVAVITSQSTGPISSTSLSEIWSTPLPSERLWAGRSLV